MTGRCYFNISDEDIRNLLPWWTLPENIKDAN